MLARSVYPDLGALIIAVNDFREAIREEASPTEVDRMGTLAIQALREVARATGGTERRPFTELRRHLGWVARFYRQGKPDGYRQDFESLAVRDLPGVIQWVGQWEATLLPIDLVKAVQGSWDTGNYQAAVRDGFVHLEGVLRAVGEVPATKGLSGDKLVTRVLGPTSPNRVSLDGRGTYEPVTSGEVEGAFYLFRGAFLLLRNAAAHRTIGYTAEQANEILNLIAFCLNLLPQRS